MYRKVTPYRLQANLEVERFNQTIEKAKSDVGGKNGKRNLMFSCWIIVWLPTVSVLLFGHNNRNKLSVPPTSTSPDGVLTTILQQDREKKKDNKISCCWPQPNIMVWDRRGSFVNLGKRNCWRLALPNTRCPILEAVCCVPISFNFISHVWELKYFYGN